MLGRLDPVIDPGGVEAPQQVDVFPEYGGFRVKAVSVSPPDRITREVRGSLESAEGEAVFQENRVLVIKRVDQPGVDEILLAVFAGRVLGLVDIVSVADTDETACAEGILHGRGDHVPEVDIPLSLAPRKVKACQIHKGP